MQTHRSLRGFTLIELSIVIVIVALLVGGVLVGRSLINASQLRAVTTEVNAYISALSTFRDKYNALPGDLPNAVQYWGAVAGGTAEGPNTTCANLTTGSSGTATCNGDNNGYIESRCGTSFGTRNYEWFRAWQHLANAGLVTGAFSGVVGPNDNEQAIIGVNVPASKLVGGGWTLRGMPTGAQMCGNTNAFLSSGALPNMRYGNPLFFGGSNGSQSTIRPILTPEDAHAIDAKIDDALPRSGNTVSWSNAQNPGCLDAGEVAYEVTNEAISCALVILTGY